MAESYLEKCIQALPEAKRTAAREAFRAVAEAGDDTLLSKLLVVLEATAAYSATIPEALVSRGDRFLADFDARLAQQATRFKPDDATASGDKEADHFHGADPHATFDKLASALDAQKAEMGRLNRNLLRLRQARLSGLLLLLINGVLLGAGLTLTIGLNGYRQAQQSERLISRLTAAGVAVRFQDAAKGPTVFIIGPTAITSSVLIKDAKGAATGIELVYPRSDQP